MTQRGYPPSKYCSPERLHGEAPSLNSSGFVRSLGLLPEKWKGLYPGGLDYWYDQSQTPDPDLDVASRIAYFRPDADPIERNHVASIMSKVL